VVIDNFNVLRAVLSPNEANSKLGIDTYAVLAATITIKYFKPVARWGSKIRQQDRRVQHCELSLCNRLQSRPKPGFAMLKKSSRITAFETHNHD
jgi:hypothetical protein